MTTRREKLVKRVQDSGFDGVLFATGPNLQYITEANEYFWQRACMKIVQGYPSAKLMPESLVYLNTEGDCTVVCIPSLKDKFPGNTVVLSYMDQFEDTLSRVIKKDTNIGIGSDCQQWMKETLHEVNPNIKATLVEDLFRDIRAIKEPQEIEILRELGKFTDDAVMYCVENLKEGMTMFDADQLLMQYGFDHNVPDFSFPPTAGFKTAGTFDKAHNFYFDRDAKLVPGTGISFDVGYMNHGYCSDWGRTVHFGKAPQLVIDGYKALNDGQCKMVDRINPYETNVNELYHFVEEEVTRQGFESYLRFRDTGALGHQIGIDVHELPMVYYEYDEVIKPGMVFASEPKMMFDGILYMRVEDMILVTETGAEFLTNFPRDFFEFGI